MLPVLDPAAPSGVRQIRVHQLRAAAIGAAVAMSYLAAAQIGFRFAVVAEQVTTVWAPTGIALAALLLGGIRFWPAVWAAAFLANASTAAPIWTALIIASGNTLEAVLAVWVLGRLPGFTVPLTRVADVLRFLVVAAGLATAVSATIGATTLCAAGLQAWAAFPQIWFEWWLGDVLGAVIVAPAILATVRHRWSRQEVLWTALFVAGAFFVAHLVFAQLLGFSAHPIEYAIFPLVIGAAVRGGLPVTTLVVLTSSVVAISHTARGGGPFAGQDLHDSLIQLQVFMSVLAATALLLGAAMTDRRRLETSLRDHADQLQESRDVLSLAMRGGSMGAWSRDLVTNDVWWSRELNEILGIPPGFRHTIAEFFEFVHPDDRPDLRRMVDDAVAQRTDYVAEFRFRTDGGAWRWMEGRGRAVYDDHGRPRTLYGIGIDVTDRKRAELALQQAKAGAEEGQQRLAETNRELGRRVLEQQTLLDVLPIGIGIATDPECRSITINRAFASTLGLSPDTNASKTAPAGERPGNFRVFTPDGVEVPDQMLPMQIAAREGTEVRELEFDVVHDDGRRVRLLEYAVPLLDEQGRSRGSIGAFVDLTVAHQHRETLARSEERYRKIFETAGVSLWEEDFSAVKAALDNLRADGVDDLQTYLEAQPEFVKDCISLVRIVDVNPATLQMFGATVKEELLSSLHRVFRPESRMVFLDELLALARGDRRFEAEASVEALDGRRLDVLINVAFPAPDDPLDRVLVSVADISHRKQAETILRQELEVRRTLAWVGASLAGELRTDKLIDAVTDASTVLTEAEFCRFVVDAADLGGGIVRVDDVTQDPRYDRNAPFQGRPDAQRPVRSYLAVPVVGRGGVVHGGLVFGHSEAGVFTERHELLAAGVAGWAAIALDNAHLYQEAAEANRLKDEFLATLSHELRTPLNAVLGWAHMLREGTMQPSMHQRALESVERNARVQAQLVEDLLDVSRIVAGKLQIKGAAVDLADVVANALDTVRASVMAKRLRLRVIAPPGGRIVVTGDADRLQQVVWNLVSNAVKFTPTGGVIEIELGRTESRAQIVVRDNGQGIDPLFRPHLFQRFRQMDASKTRQHGGLGLGLSIVRHLVEAHGGTVAAESEGLGHGATFRVELPLRGDDLPAEPPPARAATTDQTLRGVRALIVDDDADATELTRYVLESRGASVAACASAGEAMHTLAEERYDVLVADLGMPDEDGVALIRAVRALPSSAPNRDIPAITLTAFSGARERDEALAAGYTAHLAKPIDPDRLIHLVSTTARR